MRVIDTALYLMRMHWYVIDSFITHIGKSSDAFCDICGSTIDRDEGMECETCGGFYCRFCWNLEKERHAATLHCLN